MIEFLVFWLARFTGIDLHWNRDEEVEGIGGW